MTDLKPLLRRCLSEIEWLQTTNSRSNGVARIGLLKDEIRATLSAPANGKPCGACEDAARICDEQANVAYELAENGRLHDDVTSALSSMANAIRSSCRHDPTPSGEDVCQWPACESGGVQCANDCNTKTGERRTAPTDKEPSRD